MSRMPFLHLMYLHLFLGLCLLLSLLFYLQFLIIHLLSFWWIFICDLIWWSFICHVFIQWPFIYNRIFFVSPFVPSISELSVSASFSWIFLCCHLVNSSDPSFAMSSFVNPSLVPSIFSQHSNESVKAIQLCLRRQGCPSHLPKANSNGKLYHRGFAA